MIEIVWEILVKQEAQGQFELMYGPGGAWSKLFSESPGFRGTTMLHDTHNPQRYLIFDLWDTEDQREQALREHVDTYAKLQADLERWTESRVEVGVFRMRAEATVRPRGKPGQRTRRSVR
ncbi:MAG: antibiotic biosynthesis monooxygenase [Anaerolineae bacterium]|nr:antibiotic biosynthesis monooxygenase [Anaerolineae bacterium]